MTKEELKQLQKLKREKDDLEKRIRDNRFTPSKIVTDTVMDYRTGEGRPVAISGYGDDTWARLRDKYIRKSVKILDEIMRMEEFLDGITDAETRRILRMRYEDGMTHEQIGQTMGVSREAIQKREQRFWAEENG